MPNTAMPMQDRQTCHLRSIRSANSAADQREQRIGEGDDEGILQRLRHMDALGDQQRRHPVGEPVEADRLEEIRHRQHDGAAAVGRGEDLHQVAVAGVLHHRRLRLRQGPAGFRGDPGLDRAHDLVGFLQAALLRQPARRFRQPEADEPDDDRARPNR